MKDGQDYSEKAAEHPIEMKDLSRQLRRMHAQQQEMIAQMEAISEEWRGIFRDTWRWLGGEDRSEEEQDGVEPSSCLFASDPPCGDCPDPGE